MNLYRKLLPSIALISIVSAVSAQDIVVGQVSPLSGIQAEAGQAARDGARLYFDKVNRDGGIQGRKIVLDARDDELTPAKTVAQARAILLEKSPVVFISTVGVANVDALVKEQVLEKGKVSLIGPTSGSAPMYSAPRVYPVRAGYAREFIKILQHFQSTGVQRLALVYQDDAFGKESLPLVEEFIRANKGMTLVASVPYSRAEPDLAKQAVAVDKSDAQAVVLYAVTKPAGSFIKNFKPLSPTTAIAVMSALDAESLVKEIGPAAAQGTLVGLFLPHPNSSREGLVREMHEAARELGRPLSNSPRFQLGYATAKVAVAAMQGVKGPITAESVERVLSQAKSFRLSDTLEVRYGGKDKGINFIDTGMISADRLVY